MIASLRQKLSKLSATVALVRSARRARRVRLGFYGFRYRKSRRRSAVIARCALAAALVLATVAAASGQLSP